LHKITITQSRIADTRTHENNSETIQVENISTFMLASPRFTISRKKKSYLDDVGGRDSKERSERRDMIKRKLRADHMICDDDDDDDDYLTKQLQSASLHSSSSSKREGTSSVNSARSQSVALNRKIDGILSAPYIESRRKHRSTSIDPIAQPVTAIPKTTTSRRRSSRRDDVTKSIDPIAQSVTTMPKTTTSRRRSSSSRRYDVTKSIDPIAQSVTTMPKTTTRRHSSSKRRDDDSKSLAPITPNGRPRRRFSLPSSSRSHSKQDSQNAVRDKEVAVSPPPQLPPATIAVLQVVTRRRSGGPLSPRLLLRKTNRTPRRARSSSKTRSSSLSRSNHSVDASSSRQSRIMSPHPVSCHSSLSRQLVTTGRGPPMPSLSDHLSQQSYAGDSDDDDDESILSSIFRTVGEIYDDCS
jgi:hypothetical protein